LFNKKKRVDLPVGKEVSMDADTPKAFSRLFRFKESAIKKKQEKKQGDSKQKDEKVNFICFIYLCISFLTLF
jgi:hypothetical protein